MTTGKCGCLTCQACDWHGSPGAADRVTDEWCAAQRGVKTTPYAIYLPVGSIGKLLVGTSIFLHCYKKNKSLMFLSSKFAMDF